MYAVWRGRAVLVSLACSSVGMSDRLGNSGRVIIVSSSTEHCAVSLAG